jgi:hypothetical protein
MDIQDEIDRSFGAGPEPGPVDALVADGRRALRRRRATTGAAALAIVLIAGGTTWAAAGPGTHARGADPSIASDTSPGPSEEESPSGPVHQSPATLEKDGTLVLQDGVTVLRRVDNPMELEPPKLSVGLVLDDNGKQVWMLIESDPGGGFSILDDAHRAATTFDRWLREAVAENEPGKVNAPAEEEPASYTGDGRLVLRDGVTILRRVDNPMGLEPPAQSVGLALDDRGRKIWMLLQTDPSGSSSTREDAGKRFATFDQWLQATCEDQRSANTDPVQVATALHGELTVARGVEVLEKVVAPAAAAAYGPVDEQVAAKLRLVDGSVVFALVGPSGATTVDPAVLEAPTMDAFLAHLRAQGDNGEGLR